MHAVQPNNQKYKKKMNANWVLYSTGSNTTKAKKMCLGKYVYCDESYPQDPRWSSVWRQVYMLWETVDASRAVKKKKNIWNWKKWPLAFASRHCYDRSRHQEVIHRQSLHLSYSQQEQPKEEKGHNAHTHSTLLRVLVFFFSSPPVLFRKLSLRVRKCPIIHHHRSQLLRLQQKKCRTTPSESSAGSGIGWIFCRLNLFVGKKRREGMTSKSINSSPRRLGMWVEF